MNWRDHLPRGATATVGGDVDTEALATLARAVEKRFEGKARRTSADLAHDLSAPDFDPHEDIVRIWDADGALVAAALAHHRLPYVSSFTELHVAPGADRRPLVNAAEAWARNLAISRIDRAPDGSQVALSIGCHGKDYEAAEAITALGYAEERFFLEMVRTFEGPVEDVMVPEGLTIRTMRQDEDVNRLAEAVADAFRDHFGFTEQPLEKRIERWRHWRTQDDWDNELVWLAEDGAELVGVNVCLRNHGSDDTEGYVASLGVRRRWRGRGLAKALLLASLVEYERRGKKSVSLHVDADSLTGATRLYEGVGMVETQRHIDYERVLREGEDLMVR